MLASIQTQKTKELILYIAGHLSLKDNHGLLLLNKSLYFIDGVSYLKTGKPISYFTYIKQEFGPAPKPFQFLSLQDEMINAEEIEIHSPKFVLRDRERFVAKRKPDINLFSAEEIIIMNDVLSKVEDCTDSQISTIRHQIPAWKAASEGEELPLFIFLLSAQPPTEDDILWAKAAIEECTE